MVGHDAEYLIRATSVGLSLGGVRILEDVDLSISPGEILTLIGPNGAGKTTLLRVILGLLAPAEGRVLRRAGITYGYVPQRIGVDRTLPLTVRRFLALPGGCSRAAAERALAEVGAGAAAKRELQALSGGELQRVLLARALLRRPAVLVLDEPLQGVDVGGQIALFRLIERLRRTHGFAVLMVSHDLHLVMRATDRVICLNHHVCCHGEPEAVSRDPAYRRLLGDAAAEAMAVYAHDHDHDHAHDAGGRAVAGRDGASGGDSVAGRG